MTCVRAELESCGDQTSGDVPDLVLAAPAGYWKKWDNHPLCTGWRPALHDVIETIKSSIGIRTFLVSMEITHIEMESPLMEPSFSGAPDMVELVL